MKSILYKFFVLVFILNLLYSCSHKKKENKEKKKTDKTSTIIIKKFSFVNSENGKTKWILYSDEAKINNLKKIADLKNVKILYENYYTIYSNFAKYYMNEKKAYLNGDVKIVDNKSFIFETDKLTFDSIKNEVNSDSKIKFSGKGIFLTALTFKGYLNRHEFILEGKVYSVIR